MPRTSLAYRALIRSALALAPWAARRDAKLRAGLTGRRDVLGRLLAWTAEARDPGRPLLWLHASSVGESLQAEAVLRTLQRAHPDWQTVFTYFSPSAAPWAAQLGADWADYLPVDRPRDTGRALDALRPAALVFSKLDLWPELATQAAARGVAVGLIAGTVSPAARRLRWPARALLRPGYAALHAAAAIGELDAARLERLGVPRERILIAGDPRFDSALERARPLPAAHPLHDAAIGPATLLAGSTWPEDEAVLLPSLRVVRRSEPAARLVIVPHEPTGARVAGLLEAARREGLTAARSGAARGPEPVLIVEEVGVLASLYTGAALAYVGGGFGRRGLHSVLEPAAAEVPVLFGPAWRGSPDAEPLLRCRAAAVVSPWFPDWLDLDSQSTHADSSPLAALWLAFLRHPEHLRAAGARGRAYVEAGAGAAARNAAVVERLMEEGSRVSARG